MPPGSYFLHRRAASTPSQPIQRCPRAATGYKADYAAELTRLRTKLFDLLPEAFVRSTLLLSAPPPCERRWAAVLQLDAVGFTAMSAALPPLEVAATMHALFSAFDAVVREHGLFKMDTVGDAYICAGFLPLSGDEAAGLERGSSSSDGFTQVCAEMLAAAKKIFRAVAAHRWPAGTVGACRIGVSAGSVVAGGLGRLQPRFHIFGDALRGAEVCEQTGRAGAVHASGEFMRVLCASVKSQESTSADMAARPAQRSNTAQANGIFARLPSLLRGSSPGPHDGNQLGDNGELKLMSVLTGPSVASNDFALEPGQLSDTQCGNVAGDDCKKPVPQKLDDILAAMDLSDWEVLQWQPADAKNKQDTTSTNEVKTVQAHYYRGRMLWREAYS